jgi:prephenate dehydrogenase
VAALSYDESPNVMIVGVGLMGQYLANRVGEWLGAAKLVLVDGADAINVDGERTRLWRQRTSRRASARSLSE